MADDIRDHTPSPRIANWLCQVVTEETTTIKSNREIVFAD